MFFAILAIVLTVLFMCIPVAALVVVHRSSVKLMKPLGAGTQSGNDRCGKGLIR